MIFKRLEQWVHVNLFSPYLKYLVNSPKGES